MAAPLGKGVSLIVRGENLTDEQAQAALTAVTQLQSSASNVAVLTAKIETLESGGAGNVDPAQFVRVHRSYAVNLNAIAEIEPLDSGDARLKMRDGSTVPCSRRYRGALDPGGAGKP